jgi:hypothetical protein
VELFFLSALQDTRGQSLAGLGKAWKAPVNDRSSLACWLHFPVYPKGIRMSIKQIVLRTFVLGAIAASATLAAKAETLDFTITGPGTYITFDLASSPTVSSFDPGGDFQINNVSVDLNGHHETTNIDFYASYVDGGLASSLFDLFGPQLFTGSLHHPTFLTGDFILTSPSDSYSYCDHGDYDLTICDPGTVTTPEPSSVLLLATGILALVGAGVTKRFAA